MKVAAGPRDCERHCSKCGQWKHFSRFRKWRDSRVRSDSGIQFAPLCRDCEQIERNERKNEDRPLATMKNRTSSHARKLGVPVRFLWVNMNWRALVPVYRAMLSPEGLCLDCGHQFLNERDIQIEHREPPRHAHDWARQHASNLSLGCGSCNNGKRKLGFASWLDAKEETRLANEEHRRSSEPGAIVPTQLEIPLEGA